MYASGERLPAAVRRFLERSIKSVEQLEVLLLVLRARDRYWDADAIADHLGLRRDHAASSLEALAGQNLLDVRLSESIKYRYGPATPSQDEIVRQIGDLWRDQRHQIVTEVTTKRHALRDFSDAFRIGKNEDDHG